MRKINFDFSKTPKDVAQQKNKQNIVKLFEQWEQVIHIFPLCHSHSFFHSITPHDNFSHIFISSHQFQSQFNCHQKKMCLMN
jgi:hypothetical protein